MIGKIDHIGIAVMNLESALKVYQMLGLKMHGIETVEDQKVRVAMLPTGESRIELLESTDPEGPIAKFIEKRGEGIHHLAFSVNDIDGTLRMLKEQGVPLVDEKSRAGAGGARVAFIHPKGTKALIELVERK